MSDISDWSATAASNTATPPDGAPEGMAASGVNDTIRECMAAVRRWYVDAEWVDWGHAPTRVDDDTFTVATDLTATYHAGRRLKVAGSATGYCIIASSSYSAPNTTVNVTMDSGNLPATLSAVYVGILSTTNSAVPQHSATLLTGTIADARLSSNVPLKNAANTFTQSQTITRAGDANLNLNNSSDGNSFFVNVGSAANLGTSTANGLLFYTNNAARGSIGSAGNWTINAPGSGTTLVVNRESGQVNTEFTDGTVTSAYYSSGASTLANFGTTSNHPLALLTNNTARITVGSGGGVQIGSPTGGDKGAGTLNTAGSIYVNNSIVALASDATNASNLSSGTVPDARFPATLPAASGANLTALDGSNISSGTVAQARLPSTSGLVPLISVGAALDISTIAVGQSAYVYKSSGTSRTNNDTLTIDPVLQFTNAPAGAYVTEGSIGISNADSVADFQISWPQAVNYSGVMSLAGYDNFGSASNLARPFISTAQELEVSSGGSSNGAISVTGIEGSIGSQTLGPLWAQATSNANATTVTAGSWLKVTRIN